MNPVWYLLRRITPNPLLHAYHFAMAYLAAAIFRFPSARLTVIGVTGTYGKSSVIMLLGRALCAAGHRTGWISSATISDGEREWLNAMKMTMPGRLFLQRFLRRLVRAGCTHAIIETSSQGITQHRHRGIAYDVAVLTNLSPEHLEAHGGFAAYRGAKARLFAHVAHGRKQTRIAVVPSDLERPGEFTFSRSDGASDPRKDKASFTRIITFRPEDTRGLTLAPALAAFPGNISAVLAVCDALGIRRAVAARALEAVRSLPGRLERIGEGQSFAVIVDYAFTPDALAAVYRALGAISGRTIHVLGGTGGGRDRWKLPALGATAAQHADTVIVTNEDPYDDDPLAIIRAVAEGARAWIAGHRRGTMGDVREILDRRAAIAEAIALAKPGDRILVTGKGCEQAIVGPRGQKIPWDDRAVVRELIRTRYEVHETI